MSPAEARRHAQLEFGGREQIKEELRDVYRVQILDAAMANLKAAFRFLRKVAVVFHRGHSDTRAWDRRKQRGLFRDRRDSAEAASLP